MFTQSAWTLNIAFAAEDLGVAVGALAIVNSVYGVCYGGSGFIWGWLADRYGLRVSFTLGCVIMGVGALLFGNFSSTPVMMAVIYGIMGIGMGSTSAALVSKLVGTWFAASRRGTGTTICTIGGNISGMLSGIIIPIIMATTGSWRGTYTLLAILGLIFAVLCWLLIRNQPSDVGTVPFGSPKGTPIMDTSVTTRKISGADWAKIFKMPITWKMGLVYILWTLWFTSQMTYLFASVRSLGFAAAIVGLALTMQRIGSFVGMWVWPYIGDRWCRKYVLGALLIVVGVYYYIMRAGMTPETPAAGVVAFIVVSGFLGASTPVIQSMLSDCYPLDLRGTGSGVVSTLTLIGRLLGPILAAAVVGATGGNSWNFVYFTGTVIIIAGILAIVLLPKTGGKYGDPMGKVTSDGRTVEEFTAEQEKKEATRD